MVALSSVFVGVPQSRYAAIAILIAIVVVALVIIFGKDPIPMSQKFAFVLLIALISIPSLALSLFQMTCLVTGSGLSDQRWWCTAYAWLLSGIMIAYAVLLVVAAIMSTSQSGREFFTDISASTEGGDGEHDEDSHDDNKKKIDLAEANAAAEQFFSKAAEPMKKAHAQDEPESFANTQVDAEAPSPAGSNKPDTFADANWAGGRVQGGADMAAPSVLPRIPTAQHVPTAQHAEGPVPSSPETFATFGATPFN